MPFPKHQYDDFYNTHTKHWKSILHPPAKPDQEGLDKFLECLLHVAHHDEYYTILDHKTLELIPYGIKRCLGYEVKDGEKGSWEYYYMLNIIHDKYREMYLKWMQLAYILTYEKRVSVRSLQHRIMINYPVEKANGNFVWVKEMTMPWQLDANNMMVTQISSYTIICRYLGFHLPMAPRFYDDEGKRAKAFEELFFKRFLEEIDFKLPERLKEVLQAIIDIDFEKTVSEKEECFKKFKMPLTTAEIAAQIFRSPGTVSVYLSKIHDIVQEKFGWDFRDYYDAALFLRGLRYVQPKRS